MAIKLVKKLTNKGFPTHNKNYEYSHKKADKIEKKAYPKGYEALKKEERHLGKKELMGKNTKSGKIEVENKFAKHKKEIALHERIEHKEIKKLSKKR
jgi:dephospho-CoA kinase